MAAYETGYYILLSDTETCVESLLKWHCHAECYQTASYAAFAQEHCISPGRLPFRMADAAGLSMRHFARAVLA